MLFNFSSLNFIFFFHLILSAQKLKNYQIKEHQTLGALNFISFEIWALLIFQRHKFPSLPNLTTLKFSIPSEFKKKSKIRSALNFKSFKKWTFSDLNILNIIFLNLIQTVLNMKKYKLKGFKIKALWILLFLKFERFQFLIALNWILFLSLTALTLKNFQIKVQKIVDALNFAILIFQIWAIQLLKRIENASEFSLILNILIKP